jgi:hypothetical protein
MPPEIQQRRFCRVAAIFRHEFTERSANVRACRHLFVKSAAGFPSVVDQRFVLVHHWERFGQGFVLRRQVSSIIAEHSQKNVLGGIGIVTVRIRRLAKGGRRWDSH